MPWHLVCPATILLAFLWVPELAAQQLVVTLDPVATQITFTLGATMHNVHGVFKLKSGQVRWDAATGKATGAIVIDATSGNTDNASRDKNMHAQVLQSAKFPEIVFTPSKVEGGLPQQGASQVKLFGVIKLHGQDHETTLNLTVQPGPNNVVQATTQFPVPFKTWGLKDPSTFLLRVADSVNVEVHATAKIESAP